MGSIDYLKNRVNANAIWLSDIHLGHKDCKALFLLDFLESIETRYLYLVGDIIDVWAMSRQIHWPVEHNQVVRKLMAMAREGVQVTYIPGNHDSSFREYCGEAFGAIKIMNRAVHHTTQGKRLLITHGDEFDNAIRFSKFNQFVGDHAYDLLLFINRCNNYIRRRLGYEYWSMAAYLKSRIANASQAIAIYEEAAVRLAKSEGYDGIVCGHIHHPNVVEKNAVVYCNDGDWVENCTALVETMDGSLEIWHWSDRNHCLKRLDGETISSSAYKTVWSKSA